MRKRLIAAAVAGTVAAGGAAAAVAIPAMADTSTPSPSAPTTSAPSTSATPGAGQPGTDQRESRIKELLKGLVGDKTLTQAQADKVAKTLAEAKDGKGLGGPGGPGRGGPGMFGAGGPEGLDAAAKALGLSADEVRSALRDGSTLADLAKKQGKSEDAVVTAIVDAVKARVAQAVKDGKLTQEQADTITGSLQDRVKTAVENGGPLGGHGPGRGGPDGQRGPGAPGTDGAAPSAPSAPPAPSSPGASPSASSETSAYVA